MKTLLFFAAALTFCLPACTRPAMPTSALPASATGEMGAPQTFAEADPFLKDAEGVTALHRAAGNGSIETAAALLKRGADVNVRDNNTNATPLYWAAAAGQTDMARFLLERGAELNAQDVDGYTPLDAATDAQAEDTLLLLLQRGAVSGEMLNDPDATPSQPANACSALPQVTPEP